MKKTILRIQVGRDELLVETLILVDRAHLDSSEIIILCPSKQHGEHPLRCQSSVFRRGM